MKYNFDIFGWYTTEDNGRETSHEPPTLSETIVPGALRANYTGIPGKEWMLLSYAVPTPIPEAISPVPSTITPRQGLMMLSRAGLLTQVRQALDAMVDQEGEEARIDFEYASEWRRDWPLLNTMSGLLGLTEAQVDQMFIEASIL